jgi:hypothetical protein
MEPVILPKGSDVPLNIVKVSILYSEICLKWTQGSIGLFNIIHNLDIFSFDFIEWYCQFQQTDFDTTNYLSVCHQTHDNITDKNFTTTMIYYICM